MKNPPNTDAIAALLSQREFNANGEPPPEDKVFRIEFQTIGSLGDYCLITGRPKAGKTKYLSGAMAAAVSRKETFGMNIKLPDHKRRVAHFDTEQGRRSHYNCLELMKQLAGVDKMPDHFNSYHCRQDTGSAIVAMVEYYLQIHPDTGIVFLDGLLDLIESFNDETHSKHLVNWLKKITEANNTLFIAILHRSMSVNKSIGHLGSSADRAAQSVLIVEKNKDTRQYILKSEYMRDGDDFTPIAIWYNKQLSLWEQTDYIEMEEGDKAKPGGFRAMRKRRADEFSRDEHAEKIKALFVLGADQSNESLINRIKEVYGVGRPWAVECRTILERENLIWRIETGWTNVQQAKLYIAT